MPAEGNRVPVAADALPGGFHAVSASGNGLLARGRADDPMPRG